MDSSKFLAHIAEDGRRQTVAEHLIDTANLSKGFARPFSAEAQAAFCCICSCQHHGGSPTDAPDQSTFCGRIKRKERGRLEPCEHWKQRSLCLSLKYRVS